MDDLQNQVISTRFRITILRLIRYLTSNYDFHFDIFNPLRKYVQYLMLSTFFGVIIVSKVLENTLFAGGRRLDG